MFLFIEKTMMTKTKPLKDSYCKNFSSISLLIGNLICSNQKINGPKLKLSWLLLILKILTS